MDYNNIDLPWKDWHIIKKIGRGSFGEVYEALKKEDDICNRIRRRMDKDRA